MYLEKLFGLNDKVAIVTGGGSGIGQAIAYGLANAGAEVAILCRSVADETIKMINKSNGNAYWLGVDVTKEEEVNTALSVILERSGSIDILFNNAGICMHQRSIEATVDDFRKVMDVNLTGSFIIARAVGKIMIDQGTAGTIINMASMSGHVVNTPQMQCSYNASKAAVIHMTKSLAVEWARQHIRVNSISPGYVATAMSKDTPKELRDAWTELIPMKRFAKPEELMTAILYLSSEASSYTTGSDIIVDGAYTCV